MTRYEIEMMNRDALGSYAAGADPDEIGYAEDDWLFDEDDVREWERDEDDYR